MARLLSVIVNGQATKCQVHLLPAAHAEPWDPGIHGTQGEDGWLQLIAMGNCAESSCGGPLALCELILTSSGIRCAQVIPLCQASHCT